MKGSWLPLRREIFESFISPYVRKRTYSEFEAYLDLILLSAGGDQEVAWSLRDLEVRWRWSDHKRVSRFLQQLERRGWLILTTGTPGSGRKRTRIIVVKPESFQGGRPQRAPDAAPKKPQRTLYKTERENLSLSPTPKPKPERRPLMEAASGGLSIRNLLANRKEEPCDSSVGNEPCSGSRAGENALIEGGTGATAKREAPTGDDTSEGGDG